MNKSRFLVELRHHELEDRVPIIQGYLQEISKEERQKFEEFYDISVQALKQSKGVTRAETRLLNNGNLIFGKIPYYLLHQMACVAAGQPIRTPKQELQNNGIKTKQTRRRYYQGKNISRLMEQRPAKIRVSKRPYDNP